MLNFFRVQPTVRTYKSSCYLFQDLSISAFGHEATLTFILTYCSFYGSAMSIFACHFIYRYGAVNTDFKQKYISGTKQGILFIAPIFTGIVWGLFCWLIMGESSTKTAFLRTHFQEEFGLKIEECAYVAYYFWPVDEDMVSYPDAMSFMGVAVMFLIVGSSFVTVVYFGIKCYQYISQQLGNVSTQSQATKTMQVQLFYSLIIQSVIPSFLMYLPAGIVFSIPILNLGYDVKFSFISYTIAIYPAIDPLPTIFMIKSYRNGLIDLLRCRKKIQITANSNKNIFVTF